MRNPGEQLGEKRGRDPGHRRDADKCQENLHHGSRPQPAQPVIGWPPRRSRAARYPATAGRCAGHPLHVRAAHVPGSLVRDGGHAAAAQLNLVDQDGAARDVLLFSAHS